MYTVEYYLTIKKNETMPFAAMWMDLEFIILLTSTYLSYLLQLSEVRQRKISII